MRNSDFSRLSIPIVSVNSDIKGFAPPENIKLSFRRSC
jgi:hypothetical protein